MNAKNITNEPSHTEMAVLTRNMLNHCSKPVAERKNVVIDNYLSRLRTFSENVSADAGRSKAALSAGIYRFPTRRSIIITAVTTTNANTTMPAARMCALPHSSRST